MGTAHGGCATTFVVSCSPDDPGATAATVASVTAQTEEDWELLVVGAGPASQAAELARGDRRIRVIGHDLGRAPAAAWNAALQEASGTFVALLDAGDRLDPAAVATVDDARRDADLVYTDETVFDPVAGSAKLWRKPTWSPERLRSQMYLGQLVLLRREVVAALGHLDPSAGTAALHDLALRIAETSDRIRHVPVDLVFRSLPWPGESRPRVTGAADDDATVAVVRRHVERRGIRATVRPGPSPGVVEVRRALDPDVRVSVLIPTRGVAAEIWGERRRLVVSCVRSVLARGGHDNIEILVGYDHPTTPREVVEELDALGDDRVHLIPHRRPFNYADKCNEMALRAKGRFLVLLNDDTEAISTEFVANLVGPLLETGVGMAGARLLFTGGRLQHAGIVHGHGHVTHAYYRAARSDPGPFGEIAVSRETSGVTGACLAVPTELFLALGGLTADLPLNFNDVDLCNKVRRAGHRILYVPHVELYHVESATRQPVVTVEEYRTLVARWGYPADDPYLPDAPLPAGSVPLAGPLPW